MSDVTTTQELSTRKYNNHKCYTHFTIYRKGQDGFILFELVNAEYAIIPIMEVLCPNWSH